MHASLLKLVILKSLKEHLFYYILFYSILYFRESLRITLLHLWDDAKEYIYLVNFVLYYIPKKTFTLICKLKERQIIRKNLLLSLDWFRIPTIRFFLAVLFNARKYPVLQNSCTICTFEGKLEVTLKIW